MLNPLGSREQLWEFAASFPHPECNRRNGAFQRIRGGGAKNTTGSTATKRVGLLLQKRFEINPASCLCSIHTGRIWICGLFYSLSLSVVKLCAPPPPPPLEISPPSHRLSLSLSRARISSHAAWMSWDTASRVCGVCCLLRSNNSRAPLAPCPAPANSTTPDRRLTCTDSWHGYRPNQSSLVLTYTAICSQICV